MVREIRKQIEQFSMIEKGDRILIGLSGGADSVCLSQILYELSEEYELELAAVSCHHGLRGEDADQDIEFARRFCQGRKIKFYEAYDDVERRSKEKGLTVEEAGREFRYETFARIMRENQYNKLAIAHNADDRAETMLFHLARGTGLAGLCTMEPVRTFFQDKKLIRPLLWTKKVKIEEWLVKNHISWRWDKTNQEDIYSRNRIRHNVLPELSLINEKAVEHMGQTAEQLGEIHSYLKEEEERIIKNVVSVEGDLMKVRIPALENSHLYMKKSVLYRCLSDLAGGRKDITAGHVKSLMELFEGESGKELHLMREIRAYKEYDFLIMTKEGQKEEEKQEKAREDILQQMEMSLEKYPYTGQEISKNKYTKHFDCDKILNELCLRFWQPGDYFYLKEDGGKKKLNRYFIDEKIPAKQRGQIPLLADGSHIVWMIGHRISAYYKVTDSTRQVLEVTIKNKG